MKTHGDAKWEQLPSYLQTVVPRVLEQLDRAGVKITVFIVGLDALQPENAPPLEAIAGAGHEIGNHSHYHEPWLHRRPIEEIDAEIALAETSITQATGKQPRGFRGPGFVRSDNIYRVLAKRGYEYDASTLATFIGPLARAYYFRSTHLSQEQRLERRDLFGSFRDGFDANRPYRVATAEGAISVVPVTTMPLVRLPIHVSYLLYIARFSPAAAAAYFESALRLCSLTHTPPSILLHPLDFIDGSDCPDLRFFPAMDMPASKKMRIAAGAIDALRSRFELGPIEELLPQSSVPMAALANE